MSTASMLGLGWAVFLGLIAFIVFCVRWIVVADRIANKVEDVVTEFKEFRKEAKEDREKHTLLAKSHDLLAQRVGYVERMLDLHRYTDDILYRGQQKDFSSWYSDRLKAAIQDVIHQNGAGE